MRNCTAWIGGLLLLVALPAGAGEAPAATLVPVDQALHGVWRQVNLTEDEAETRETLEITATHCAVARGEKLNRIDPVIGQEGDVLVRSVHNNRVRFRFTLSGDTLTLSGQLPRAPEPFETHYERLAERPQVFDLKPLPLGDATRPLTPERIAALQTELAARREKDQELRRKPDLTPEDWKVINEIDRGNVAYLKELIAEIGWVDRERFGPEAASAAFLIVQHSGELDLMVTALPLLEKEAEATGKGGSYALLYDRTQLRIGCKQRYGSQIGSWPDGGGLFVSPLEDPAHVDERRAKLGMQPLREYVEYFKARNDGKDLPIREDF